MKITIPKELKGFAFDQVIPLDFNSFDVDLLLPNLFFKVVSRGQIIGRQANDATRIREYSAAFANHAEVLGFEEDVRLADRLVRTALVKTGRPNRSRDFEQIEGVLSHTFLTFKPGFPTHRGSLRRVDGLIYRMMRDQLGGEEEVLAFFRRVFGVGLKLQTGAVPDGVYDQTADLDTVTRLSIAYLGGFQPTGTKKRAERLPWNALPLVTSLMSRDMRHYLDAYSRVMPIDALTYHFKALVNFELWAFSVKLFRAIGDLVERPTQMPAAMTGRNVVSPPEVFVDFAGRSSGHGKEMSSASVRRDLESMQRFIHANLSLRYRDHLVEGLRRDRRVKDAVDAVLGPDEGGPKYLQGLLALTDHPVLSMWISMAAQYQEGLIRDSNIGSSSTDDDDDSMRHLEDEFDRIAESAETSIDRLILLLREGQRQRTSTLLSDWYKSVGGLQKSHGILTGHLKSRQSWRYAPSNDLLATLVQLAAVDIPEWDENDPRPRPIKLRDFLAWLERRFGIIVDRPPDGFEGAEYVAAAQENLRAMLRRLQQMGVFRDLSDDFTVQRLIPPYVAEESLSR